MIWVWDSLFVESKHHLREIDLLLEFFILKCGDYANLIGKQ